VVATAESLPAALANMYRGGSRTDNIRDPGKKTVLAWLEEGKMMPASSFSLGLASDDGDEQ